MATNYKILRRAQLVDDLFVKDPDEAAWEQEEADRDWAKGVESDLLGDIEGASEASSKIESEEPVESYRQAPPVTLEAPSEPGPSTALVRVAPPMRPEPEPERGWSQALADLTGNANLEGIQCIGVCGLERSVGAGEATAALAHWVSQYGKGPALVVEAHFGESRLAGRFGVTAIGVSDVLLGKSSLETLIQDTADDNLKVLTAGARIGFFSRGRAIQAAPDLIGSLRLRFDAVIVELPAIDDPVFSKLPIASLVDAVVLSACSRTSQESKLRRAADVLRRANVSLAATMLCSTQSFEATPRPGQISRLIQPEDEQESVFQPLS